MNMDNRETAVTLERHTGQLERHEGRIKLLEQQAEAIHGLAKSTALMAQELEGMGRKLSTLATDVQAIKERPGRRWETVTERIVLVIVGAVVAFALGRLGL